MHAILKVSVMLKHPPNIELVLRKRISLRIVKKGGFVSSIKNRLSTAPTQTGVMYEVVTGKPKVIYYILMYMQNILFVLMTLVRRNVASI